MSEPNQENFDACCAEFESAWKAGQQPEIETFLDRVTSEQQAELLKELIQVELWWRRDEVPPPNKESYLQRFSNFAEIIHAAFAEYATPTMLPGEEQSQPTLPKSVGPYKILQQIGSGGMGQVYMAEQSEPVKRRVALKLIRNAGPSREVLARFEAERQALAMMDHQNIAKVLDADVTEDGLPYFAMELVKGVPITEYCDSNKLTLNERLDLFVQTCRAIQHAHQKGIIHRDIKPSNVLVTLYDGKPVAKVIDFGLAKALQEHSRLTDKTLFTQFGQVVGTLAYMSPEQAEMNALDVDARTDVYSLGVILYELLTGSTPISRERIRTEALDRILAMIREGETPRPSTRLSESGDAITGISEQRRTEPRKLSLILRGDLDWIAVKALEKDRTRRYDTPSALADDVQRFINNDAIEARPPSMGYRFQKVMRKHKAKFVAATTILVLLIVGIISTTAMYYRARDAEARAIAGETKTKDALKLANEERDTAQVERDRARKAEETAEAAQQRASTALLVTQRNLESALRNVNELLRIGFDESLDKIPEVRLLRRKMLAQVVAHHQELSNSQELSDELTIQAAEIWLDIAALQRMLDQDAVHSIENSSHLLEQIRSKQLTDTALIRKIATAELEVAKRWFEQAFVVVNRHWVYSGLEDEAERLQDKLDAMGTYSAKEKKHRQIAANLFTRIGDTAAAKRASGATLPNVQFRDPISVFKLTQDMDKTIKSEREAGSPKSLAALLLKFAEELKHDNPRKAWDFARESKEAFASINRTDTRELFNLGQTLRLSSELRDEIDATDDVVIQELVADIERDIELTLEFAHLETPGKMNNESKPYLETYAEFRVSKLIGELVRLLDKDDVVRNLDALVEKYPKEPLFKHERAYRLQALGQRLAAYERFGELLSLDCNNWAAFDSWYTLLFDEKGASGSKNPDRVMAAIGLLDSVIATSPRCVPALTYRGILYRFCGRLDASLLDLERAVSTSGDEIDKRLNLALAWTFARIGNSDSAEEQLMQFARKEGDDWDSSVRIQPRNFDREYELALNTFGMARDLLKHGKLREATQLAAPLLASMESFWKGFVSRQLIDACLELGDLKQALNLAEQLGDFGVDDLNQHRARAKVFFRSQQFSQALDEIQKSREADEEWYDLNWISISPSDLATCTDSKFREGICQLIEDAITASNEVFHREQVLWSSIKYFVAINLIERATQVAEEAKTLKPFWVHKQLGLLYLRDNQLASYQKLCAEMVELASDSEDYSELNSAAWVCCLAPNAVEDYSKPLGLAKRAVQMDPDSATRPTLGMILFRKGDLEEARQELMQALAHISPQSSNYSTYVLPLVIVEWKLGNHESAREMLAHAKKEEEARDSRKASWNTKLLIQMLLAEAEAVID